MKYRQRIIDVVREYNNKERICGSVDCNLMILQIYELEKYIKLKDKYNTIKQGIKLAKEVTGYRSIKEYLELSPKYTKIPFKAARFGDIGTVIDKQCTFLHLGQYVFGIVNKNNKEIFLNSKPIMSPEQHEFYRRL